MELLKFAKRRIKKMIIKRTETLEGEENVTYLQSDGSFGKKETARFFCCREKAEDYIDSEECDPKYDKPWMGKCEFDIEN
jgi:hypothetical protein